MSFIRLLKRKEIIRLKNGMEIYAPIPRKFLFPNDIFSNEPLKGLITIGEVLTSNKFPDEDFKEGLVNYLEMYNIKNKEGVIEEFIKNLNIDTPSENFDTSIFEGKYRIYFAKMENEGHHVYCESTADPSLEIDFFQNCDSRFYN